ncbi:MAG: hypothetical protein HPY51_00690 [Candidatus Omnitrophica bacterium]|nr:hypothetical protein [Candidatus Omnitrophota bacterium]
MFLSPFYLFPSGTPQIADWVVCFLSFLIFLDIILSSKIQIPSGNRMVLIFFLMFTIYSFIINIYWSVALDNLHILINSLYYIFNLVVIFDILYLYSLYKNYFFNFFLITLILTVIAQFIFIYFEPIDNARGVGFFNNPNQLGYYALLTTSMILLNDHYIGKYKLLSMLGVSASIYLSLISLSKASMVGIFFLIILHTLNNIRALLIIICTSVITYVLIAGIDYENYLFRYTVVSSAFGRIMMIGHDMDDSWEGRGYDRIILYNDLIFLGAGEGAFERYDTSMQGELHSSWGTLIFCYGIPGSLLFGAALLRVCMMCGFRVCLYLVPALAYGLTHQGLRFTLFWILLSFVLLLKNESLKNSGVINSINVRTNH